MIKNTFLIDSNILIYSCDTSNEKKHKIAETLLENCFERGQTYVVSTQNLAEFFSVIKNKLKDKKSSDDAKALITCILEFRPFKKLSYNEQTISSAIKICEDVNTSFWDALIAATMLEYGITHIYTENTKDFKKISGIVAVNPFKNMP